MKLFENNKITYKRFAMFMGLVLIVTFVGSIILYPDFYKNKPEQIKDEELPEEVTGATDASIYGLISSDTRDQSAEFEKMLNADEQLISLKSGTYIINKTIYTYRGNAKRIVGEPGTVIKINLPLGAKMVNITKNIGFENITFDFNQGNVTTALNYSENLGTIVLKNVKFINLNDKSNTTSSTLIFIPTNGNTVDIDTVEFSNIYKLGNSVIGDYAGNVTGLYYGDHLTSAMANGTIKNITVKEMHNRDVAGNILFEDTSGVYISSKYSGDASKLLIDGVNGSNFGKRLVKLDAKNIDLKNVYASSIYNDQLVAVGVNANVVVSGNITMDNINVQGISNIGISLDGNGFKLSNININLQKGTWDNAFGVLVAAKNVSIDGAMISASRTVFLHDSYDTIDNFSLNNADLTVTNEGTHAVHYNETSYGFTNMTLSNIHVNYKATAQYRTSFLAMEGFDGTVNKSGSNLNISNITVDSSSQYDTGIRLKNVKGFTIDKFKFGHVNTTSTLQEGTPIFLNSVSDGVINDLVSVNAVQYLNTANVVETTTPIVETVPAEVVTDTTTTETPIVDLLPSDSTTSGSDTTSGTTPETTTDTTTVTEPIVTEPVVEVAKTIEITGPSTLDVVSTPMVAQYSGVVYQGDQVLSEKLVWYISGNPYADINSTGSLTLLSGLAGPTVKVCAYLASDSNIRFEKLVNLNYIPLPKTITIDGASSLVVGTGTVTSQYVGTIYQGSSNLTEKLVWYISGNSMVDIDSTGKISVSEGVTTTSVKVGAYLASDPTVKTEKSVSLTIVVPAKVLTITGASTYTVTKVPTQIQYTGVITQGSKVITEKIVWYISGNTKVDIDGSGKVTLLKGISRNTFKVGGYLLSDPTIRFEKLVTLDLSKLR